MGRAIMIIGAGALAVGVIIYALIECAQAEAYRVRAVPKWAWLLVILLLPVVGAVLWLFFGRPTSSPARPASRAKGPDDDPQFLRNLEERRRQQEQARKLQEWENDLKRRGDAPGSDPGPETDIDPDDPRLDPPPSGSGPASS